MLYTYDLHNAISQCYFNKEGRKEGEEGEEEGKKVNAQSAQFITR